MDECPSRSATALMCTPCSSHATAAECHSNGRQTGLQSFLPRASKTAPWLCREDTCAAPPHTHDGETLMPKAPRICPGDDGHCTNLIRHGAYCPDCTPKVWCGPRTRSSGVTNTAAWKRLRRTVLERDGHQCQVRGPACTGHATQVDHIINVANGGAELDPANCQAICTPCNARKASAEGAAARARRKAQRPKPLHPGLMR
jgi:5-methylcytosine-specific restriction enzyme A